MTEVISDSVVLDARGVALLAEQGVGGVKEGQSVTLSVSVDRQSKPKAAMLGVSEGDAGTITLDQARSLVTISTWIMCWMCCRRRPLRRFLLNAA
jgi:hypothetical protein